MRRPDPDLHADRRTRILEAALRVFARKGLQSATMPDIAAEAGMSAANLYHYVRSKDAILEALAEDERRETLVALEAIGRSDDLVDGLIAVIERELQHNDEAELVLGLEVAVEACRNPRIGEIFTRIDHEMTGRVVQLLEQGRADGRISPRHRRSRHCDRDPVDHRGHLLAPRLRSGIRHQGHSRRAAPHAHRLPAARRPHPIMSPS